MIWSTIRKRRNYSLKLGKHGCAVKTGLGMLVHQGAKALEIWTGKEVDAQIMHKVAEWRSKIRRITKRKRIWN